MIFARKINKIPESYMICARKTPEFYIIIALSIFFPIFRIFFVPRLLRLCSFILSSHTQTKNLVFRVQIPSSLNNLTCITKTHQQQNPLSNRDLMFIITAVLTTFNSPGLVLSVTTILCHFS